MKAVGQLAKIFLITLLILTGLLIMAWLIPETMVYDHAKEGIKLLKENEEAWEEHFTYAWGAKLDNTTDLIMLDRAVSTADKSKSIFYKAFYCNDYARYWHGYLIILRPLLSVMSYMQIRYLYMAIHMIAFVAIALKIEKRFDRKMMWGWVVSMIAVNFVALPFSLQYSWVFFIMYGVLCYIDRCYGKNRRIDSVSAASIFLVTGMLTSFIDLLTAPLLTLGIPLLYFLMIRIRLEKEVSCKRNIVMMTALSASWAAGYIGCWAMKWILAIPILKENLIAEAVMRIGVQTKGSVELGASGGENVSSSLFKALAYNVYALLPPGLTHEIELDIWMPFFVVIFICIVILAILFVRFHESTDKLISYIPIGILMLYPYLWYAVTTRHAQVHPMFTYRDQIITVMGGWIIISQCIRWSEIRKKRGQWSNEEDKYNDSLL